MLCGWEYDSCVFHKILSHLKIKQTQRKQFNEREYHILIFRSCNSPWLVIPAVSSAFFSGSFIPVNTDGEKAFLSLHSSPFCSLKTLHPSHCLCWLFTVWGWTVLSSQTAFEQRTESRPGWPYHKSCGRRSWWQQTNRAFEDVNSLGRFPLWACPSALSFSPAL